MPNSKAYFEIKECVFIEVGTFAFKWETLNLQIFWMGYHWADMLPQMGLFPVRPVSGQPEGLKTRRQLTDLSVCRRTSLIWTLSAASVAGGGSPVWTAGSPPHSPRWSSSPPPRCRRRPRPAARWRALWAAGCWTWPRARWARDVETRAFCFQTLISEEKTAAQCAKGLLSRWRLCSSDRKNYG